MEEELQEAEVLWPETRTNNAHGKPQVASEPGSTRKPKKSSTPITIPNSLDKGRSRNAVEPPFDDGDQIVPPHVIVSRRYSGDTPFSMHAGGGRTLKGRDLKQVRNSVLRLTGFLEG